MTHYYKLTDGEHKGSIIDVAKIVVIKPGSDLSGIMFENGEYINIKIVSEDMKVIENILVEELLDV